MKLVDLLVVSGQSSLVVPAVRLLGAIPVVGLSRLKGEVVKNADEAIGPALSLCATGWNGT